MKKSRAYLVSFGLVLFAPMGHAGDTFENSGDGSQRGREDNITFQNAMRAHRADDFDLAQELWEELRKPNDRPEILNNLAVLADAKGDNARALQLLQLASKLSPHYFSIRRNLQQLGSSDALDGLQSTAEPRRLQLIEELPTRGIPVLADSSINFTAVEAHLVDLPPAPDVYTPEQLAMNREFQPPQPAYSGEPTDSLAIDNVAKIKKALDDWMTSWMRRDTGSYLASYDISFIPQNGITRTKWELTRHARIQAAQNVKIRISDLQLDVDRNSTTARARFVQDYQSDSFQDKVVKTLQLTKRNGVWRISSENTQSM